MNKTGCHFTRPTQKLSPLPHYLVPTTLSSTSFSLSLLILTSHLSNFAQPQRVRDLANILKIFFYHNPAQDVKMSDHEIIQAIKGVDRPEPPTTQGRVNAAKGIIQSVLSQDYDLKELKDLRKIVWDYRKSLDKVSPRDTADSKRTRYRYSLCIDISYILQGLEYKLAGGPDDELCKNLEATLGEPLEGKEKDASAGVQKGVDGECDEEEDWVLV
ncbi:hypothetical protein B0H65DRAFT_570676 [Neurospora tetraspora]|uniref:Uncharacterized protein n=1 Tax=Neurospora tetraspora TaxID=94610 RepID=A0AAE0JGX6_9PEZI|nr:hypothetical protein B0H65DRAFT_570676 [Neurospora tetraspora]